MDGERICARAALRFFAGLLLTALLLFLPAGTLDWPQGWRLLGALFLPMLAAGLVMARKSPELLRRRLNAREAQPEQRGVVWFSALLFLAAFVLAGLNRRFGWFALPDGVSLGATAAFLAGYGLYAETMRENAWLSRTVEVQRDQRVVDTGLYGVVRHPMYAATLIMFLSIPLILGSPPSFAVMLLYPPVLRRRILNEEALLSRELAGYAEYMQRIRYRVIPWIW